MAEWEDLGISVKKVQNEKKKKAVSTKLFKKYMMKNI